MVKRRKDRKVKVNSDEIEGPNEATETYEEFIEEMTEQEAPDSSPKSSKELTSKKLDHTKSLLLKEKRKGVKGALSLFKRALSATEKMNEFSDESLLFQALELSLVILPDFFVAKIKEAKHWKRLKPLFKNYIATLLYLFKQIKVSELIQMVCSALAKLLPLKDLFQEYAESIVRTTAKHWAEGEKTSKMLCFDLLRKFQQVHFIDSLALLKSVYLQYAAHTKFMSWSKYEAVQTMQRCFIDLAGVDMDASYQVVFIYLRQLSVHLAHSIRHPSTDKVKTLYNWQFLNSFALLGQTIAQYPKGLGELMHPFVQLGSGLLKITNAPKCFPYKLHAVRVLVAVQRASKSYIPGITPHLLSILLAPSLYKKSRNSNVKNFSFLMAIKASKDQLASNFYKEALVQETCEAVTEHLAAVSSSIAFVEIALPVRIALKKQVKVTKEPTIRAKINLLVKNVLENSEWIERERSKMNLPVKDSPLFLGGNPPLNKHADKILKDRKLLASSHSK